MAEPDIISIAMLPHIFPEVQRAFERTFPGLKLYRMPPGAEEDGEHAYGIMPRVPETHVSGDA